MNILYFPNIFVNFNWKPKTSNFLRNSDQCPIVHRIPHISVPYRKDRCTKADRFLLECNNPPSVSCAPVNGMNFEQILPLRKRAHLCCHPIRKLKWLVLHDLYFVFIVKMLQ